MKATWHDKTIAKSDETIQVEGNEYFPVDSINKEFLKKSEETYTCPLKGVADYYDVVVGDEVNKGTAWTYPNPKPGYETIANKFAFWRGVSIDT